MPASSKKHMAQTRCLRIAMEGARRGAPTCLVPRDCVCQDSGLAGIEHLSDRVWALVRPATVGRSDFTMCTLSVGLENGPMVAVAGRKRSTLRA